MSDHHHEQKTPHHATANQQQPHSQAAASSMAQDVEIGIPADSQVAKACGYMTRAKQSLAHMTLDELEETLPLPAEESILPLEDGEEYQYFLQVCKCMKLTDATVRHAWLAPV